LSFPPARGVPGSGADIAVGRTRSGMATAIFGKRQSIERSSFF
jgi:hypothetical protein